MTEQAAHAARVLVVEDEKSIRITMQEFLRADGYGVLSFPDGESALEEIDASPVDVIVSDILLPGMSGIDLLHRIREVSPRTQVILMTGEPSLETASGAVRSRAFDYLSKPVSRETILQSVRRAAEAKARDDEHDRLQEENRRHREQLEELVEERTRALALSRERYSRATRGANAGVWDWDIASGDIYVDPLLKAMLGYEDAEIPNRIDDWASHVDPEDRDLVMKEAQAALDGRKPVYEVVHRMRHKDGSRVWFLARGEVIRDATGTPVRMVGTDIEMGERKRLEQALRAQTQRLESLFRAVPDLVFRLDRNGTFLDFNSPSGADLYAAPGDFLGKNHRDVLPPDVSAATGRAIEAALETATVQRYEYRLPIEGKLRDFEAWMTKLTDDEVVAMIRDVTANRQAAQRLRRLNRTLRVVTECSRELVAAPGEIEWLNQLCRVAVDEGGYRMAWVGYAEEDEAKSVRPVAEAGFGDGYLDTVNITWADAERGRGPTGTAIRTGQPAIARNIPTDPAYAPWRATAVKRGYASSIALPLVTDAKTLGALNVYASEPDAFDADEVELLSQLARDLAYGIAALRRRAERRQAEAALMRNEELLASSQRIGRIGGWEWDMVRQTMFWTDETYRIHDLEPGVVAQGTAEHIARSIECYDPEDRPRLMAAFQRCTELGESYELELPFTTTKGRRLWIRTAAHAVMEGDRVVRATGYIQDITASREAEIDLLAAQRQLAETEKFAAIGRLSAGIAHEINNPLASIASSAELLEERIVTLDHPGRDPAVGKHLGRIQHNVERCRTIIDGVRGFVRKEACTPVEIDMLETVSHIAESLRGEGSLAERQIRCVHDVFGVEDVRPNLGVVWELRGVPEDMRMCRVRAAPSQMERVLSNLLRNAIEATDEHGVLALGCRQSENGVEVAIGDNGSGISDEAQAYIFEPFYSTKKGRGIGLGLYMCRQLIEFMGGKLTCESRLGVGSIFRMWLPASGAPTTAANARRRQEDQELD